MSIQQGVIYLEKTNGGKGILIDGVSELDQPHCNISGGAVGTAACEEQ